MAGEERIDDRYLVATVFEILLQWPMINGGGFHDHCNLILGIGCDPTFDFLCLLGSVIKVRLLDDALHPVLDS